MISSDEAKNRSYLLLLSTVETSYDDIRSRVICTSCADPSVYSGISMLWRLAGIVLVGVGAAGIVLPLLPATPFLLLSAYCFAQSSQRMHDWLVNHQWFGPPIRNWQHNHSIDRRSKLIASAMLILTPVITFFLDAPVWAIFLQAVVLASAAAFIWSRSEP